MASWSERAGGLGVAANRVTDSEFGILFYRASQCAARDNVVTGSRSAAIMTLDGDAVAATGNAVRISGIAIGAILGTRTRVLGNEVRDGDAGLELVSEVDSELLDNDVTETVGFGIAAFQAQRRLTLRGNRVIRCGYVDRDHAPPAVGIIVIDGEAAVALDGCEVLDTAEAPEDRQPFKGPRFGVLVQNDRQRDGPRLPGVEPSAAGRPGRSASRVAGHPARGLGRRRADPRCDLRGRHRQRGRAGGRGDRRGHVGSRRGVRRQPLHQPGRARRVRAARA